MRQVKVCAAVIGGLATGCFTGVAMGCDVLYPGSHLCGIYGVFIGAPAGSVLGAVCGRRWARKAS